MEEEINEFIELKRLIKKLEEELSVKNSENLILSKQNIDIKRLLDELQKAFRLSSLAYTNLFFTCVVIIVCKFTAFSINKVCK